MRRSEKILTAILLLGLLAWQGGRLVNRLVIDPIRQSRTALGRLDARLAEQEREAVELSRAKENLERWRRRSLPPDPLTAQRLYQRWLNDLAQDCGFVEPRVFPDRVIRKNDACMGALVSIDAEARLEQICQFLSRFYRTDLAQQITSLSITSPQNRGDSTLRVAITAEGLLMLDAPTRQRLFPTGKLGGALSEQDTTVKIVEGDGFPMTAGFLVRIGGEYVRTVEVTGTQWVVQRGADRSVPTIHADGDLVELVPVIETLRDVSRSPDYSDLVSRNPFRKPAPKIVEPTPRAPDEPPEIDPAEFTYLVGAFAQNDLRQAWLYDRLNNENVIVGLGEFFSVAGIEGVMQTIGDNFVLLDQGESRWRLGLGKNLRSMERVPGAIGTSN